MTPKLLDRPLPRLTLGTLLLFAAVSSVGADDVRTTRLRTSETHDQPCVLLRNGNVVFGVAEQHGEQVLVRRGDGSKIRLARKQVLCWANRITDLYQYRVDHRIGDSVTSHLDDARWCLHHDLLTQALTELSTVRRLDPTNRQAELLYRQIHGAAADRGAGERRPEETRPSEPKLFAPSVTIDDSPVKQVDHQVAVDTQMLSTFVSNVQPILINRCSTCHSHTSGLQWTLLKPPRGVRTSARMARENYVSTIRYIDFDHPSKSDLLRFASTNHGGGDAPIGPRNAMAGETLKRWASLVADHEAAAMQAQSARSQTTTSSTAATSRSSQEFGGRELAEPPIRQPDSPRDVGATKPTRMQRLPQIANPFDPKLFNRKFHREDLR